MTRAVEQALEALQTDAAGEAGHFSYRCGIRRARSELLRAQSEVAESNYEPEVVLAQLATKEQDWGAAVEHWERAGKLGHRLTPDERADYALALAEQGSYSRAEMTLRGAGKGRSTRGRTVERRTDDWVRGYLTRASHDVRSADEAKARTLLAAALALDNRDEDEIGEIASAVALAHQYRATGSIDWSPARPADTETAVVPRSIFVSGFLYSGSGAVMDYLQGHDGVAVAYSRKELGCFFGSYGSWKVLASDGQERRGHTANFVSWSFLGVRPPYEVPPDAPKASVARIVKSAEERAALRTTGLALLASLPAPEDQPKCDVERALGTALGRVLSIGRKSSDLLLVNNSLRPYQLELLDLSPPGAAIAVTRDPRDQYVTQLQSPNPLGVERFIEQARERVAAFNEYLEKGARRGDVIQIQFEDFVWSKSVRDGLSKALGLPTPTRWSSGKFSASDSARNIGIHSSYQNQSEIREIERELRGLIPDL